MVAPASTLGVRLGKYGPEQGKCDSLVVLARDTMVHEEGGSYMNKGSATGRSRLRSVLLLYKEGATLWNGPALYSLVWD